MFAHLLAHFTSQNTKDEVARLLLTSGRVAFRELSSSGSASSAPLLPTIFSEGNESNVLLEEKAGGSKQTMIVMELNT